MKDDFDSFYFGRYFLLTQIILLFELETMQKYFYSRYYICIGDRFIISNLFVQYGTEQTYHVLNQHINGTCTKSAKS